MPLCSSPITRLNQVFRSRVPALTSAKAEAAKKPVDCVVLLHGLARTKKSMVQLETHLKQEGFCTVNTGYPSRKKTIETLSSETIPAAIKACKVSNASKIHFVTHSLGGILVRYYLARHTVPNLGRVVMLSPPNRGSEVVDRLKHLKLFQWINGPAGNQLGTENNRFLNDIGEPNYETGIITGDRTINFVLSLLIPGPDDGKVSVENAKLAGMKDFLVVHRSHPFIMTDKTVCRQVVAFLRNGRFDRT